MAVLAPVLRAAVGDASLYAWPRESAAVFKCWNTLIEQYQAMDLLSATDYR